MIPDTDKLENVFDIILHAHKLGDGYWLQEYFIILDQPEWKTDDTVLIISKNFKESVDSKL